VVVGVIRAELRIFGASSLKEKRAVLRRIKDRVRERHNVSIAEIGHQDLWQRALLGVATVSLSEQDVNRTLQRLREEIETLLPDGIVEWEQDIFE